MLKASGCLGVMLLAVAPGCSSGPPKAMIEYGDFRLTVVADEGVYQSGGAAQLGLKVEYTGQQATEVMYNSGQSFDFQVRRDGETVWAWSNGRFFTMAIRHRGIPIGWSEDFTATWDLMDNEGQAVPPGTYEIIGVWAVRERHTTIPITVRIE